MRFIFEIIFCIGAAYGIGWFFSSYYGRAAHQPGDFDGLRHERQHPGALALVKRVQGPASAAPARPMRDKNWLS